MATLRLQDKPTRSKLHSKLLNVEFDLRGRGKLASNLASDGSISVLYRDSEWRVSGKKCGRIVHQP